MKRTTTIAAALLALATPASAQGYDVSPYTGAIYPHSPPPPLYWPPPRRPSPPSQPMRQFAERPIGVSPEAWLQELERRGCVEPGQSIGKEPPYIVNQLTRPSGWSAWEWGDELRRRGCFK
jgi:hypothetical protein